jgi:hypothetical protein
MGRGVSYEIMSRDEERFGRHRILAVSFDGEDPRLEADLQRA